MIDPLKSLPGYALRRASVSILAELSKKLIPLELRFTDISVLKLIEANPGISPSALGRVLDIKRANMTPLAARLEERGLIARVPVNGRSHGLTLTASGKMISDQGQAIMDAHEEEIIARVPAEHRPHLLPALTALWGQA